MEEKTTLNVVVHKAALQLGQGETLGMYTGALSNAVKEHAIQKLNLGKMASVWLAEVMADKCVASVYDYKEGSGSVSKYYAVSYAREKDGMFKMGDMAEVRPVTTYAPVQGGPMGMIPKASMPHEVKTKKAAEADPIGEHWQAAEKAEWTAAFINDLPDGSFAYIAPGGKKDKDGKTAPRSLRMLPFKDADGKVDVAHLRNALARLSQANIPASALAGVKAKLQAAAKEHLKGSQTEKVAKSFWANVL